MVLFVIAMFQCHWPLETEAQEVDSFSDSEGMKKQAQMHQRCCSLAKTPAQEYYVRSCIKAYMHVDILS